MYKVEEQAVIEGLIGRYLLRPSSPHIAKKYYPVYEHLHSGKVTAPDLKQIKMALQFFMPMYDGQPDVQSGIAAALLQTDALLRNTVAS